MDRFEIAIVDYCEGNYSEHVFEVVEYYINGLELLDIIEAALGSDYFNKYKYVGISAKDACLPSTCLLEHTESIDYDRTVLYVCSDCGFAMCEAIEAEVVMDDEIVIWRKFTATTVRGAASLKALADLEFRFSRADYENALRYHPAKKVVGYVKNYAVDVRKD